MAADDCPPPGSGVGGGGGGRAGLDSGEAADPATAMVTMETARRTAAAALGLGFCFFGFFSVFYFCVRVT